ncbi:NAD(P)/FAD-dependent oxidoreductase [Rhodanobacter glycinis]|uniref:NAD(P)/FAD-dependent oxidoreductase n=1 Tax=Rhodanobacter glycinis TaxID=582702 RepID=A0A502BXY6_9GAMM|nr:NAD(P)/FAD-dependent oxidoreductase [Rhodanobacter glycinis]TPG05370.1 NAD(P)/FAD-dependent oxidoreductase [Rhodanobacter glycinis]
MIDADAIIVGAGPAGLACAASMRLRGLDVTMLEKAGAVASVWRRHYDRLHLHTDRGHSGLPGLPMPRSYPRYPSRAQVVAYLESYAAHFDLRPIFDSTVRTVRRDGSTWRVETKQEQFTAPVVVIATGWADFPHRPGWPGSDGYRGVVVHSSEYRNPAAYAGKRVLVVGFGNSGGEIALDLAEAGVDVSLSVRGPVQILPRELLGLPILTWAIAQARLPARVADFINAPAIRLAVGSLRKLGLKAAGKGPRRMIEEDRRIPLLDVGTLARIRDGSIKLRGDIARFTDEGVAFVDSPAERFDGLVLATGFRPDLRQLLPGVRGVFDKHGMPLVTGRATPEPGLFFCGLIASPTGQLREIGIEARRIAQIVAPSLPR